MKTPADFRFAAAALLLAAAFSAGAFTLDDDAVAPLETFPRALNEDYTE